MRLKIIELCRVDQAHDRSGTLAGAQRASEQPILAPQRDGPDAVLHPVVVDGKRAVFKESRERDPALEAVVNGSGGG